MRVYVVTGLELGWDCVVGIYCANTVNLESLQAEFPSDAYVITRCEVETKILV